MEIFMKLLKKNEIKQFKKFKLTVNNEIWCQ